MKILIFRSDHTFFDPEILGVLKSITGVSTSITTLSPGSIFHGIFEDDEGAMIELHSDFGAIVFDAWKPTHLRFFKDLSARVDGLSVTNMNYDFDLKLADDGALSSLESHLGLSS